MQKYPKKINSTILSLIIFTGSIPCAVAAPPELDEINDANPQFIENSSEFNAAQNLDDSNLQPYAATEQLPPIEEWEHLLSNTQHSQSSNTSESSSTESQPSGSVKPRAIGINDKYLTSGESVLIPTPINIYSILKKDVYRKRYLSSLKFTKENKPFRSTTVVKENIAKENSLMWHLKRVAENPISKAKSKTESLKSLKSQEEKEPDSFEDNPETIEAFKCVSHYIFNASYKELQKTQNFQNINELKNSFIDSMDLKFLEIVQSACMSCIENDTKLQCNVKECLKKFIKFSNALDNSAENACILTLIYSQILGIKYPPSPAPIFLESIKIVSQNLYKRLDSMNELNIKPIIETQDITKLDSEKKSYFSFYCSVIDCISHKPMDIDTLYNRIITNPYLNQ